MRKLVYYVAATLDGFIAGPDGQFDFFRFEGEVAEMILAEFPETMPVQARGPLGVAAAPNRHFDTVIMGRGTYGPGLAAGITSPYPHLRQYVVSSTLTTTESEVEIVADDPVGFVRDLKRQPGQDIWLAGGGKLATTLLDEIDELIIKYNSVIIGTGIPLFDGPFTPTAFTAESTRVFEPGVTVATYAKR